MSTTLVRTSARLTATRARILAERGLTTVEYAIGLLGAAAAALLLLRIFNDNRLFESLFDYVTNIFANLAESR